MLHEVGIDSYYILLNTDRDYLAPDFPSPLHFNHVILAIRLPGVERVPNAFALIRHDKFGSLLAFDPTDSSTPLGYLPPSLQSNEGLLVTDVDGELVKFPLLPPSANRLLREATLSIDKQGTLKGKVKELRLGPFATDLRERLWNLPKNQRQKVFQHILADLVDGAVLTGAAVSGLKDFSEELSLTYDFTVGAYAQRAGNLFLFRSCALGRKGRTLLDGNTRSEPIEFSHTVLEGDTVDISLPTDYVLDETPQAVKYEYPFARYESEIRIAEHVLHYSRSYEIRDVRIPLEQLGDLKKFFRQVSDDERAYTVLKLQ